MALEAILARRPHNVLRGQHFLKVVRRVLIIPSMVKRFAMRVLQERRVPATRPIQERVPCVSTAKKDRVLALCVRMVHTELR